MNSKDLVEKIVETLTQGTGTVTFHEDADGAVFEIFSTQNAALVGRKKANIEALRTLAKAVGYNGKHRIKVVLRERKQEA